MLDALASVRDGRIYIATCLVLSLLGTGLLVAHYISDGVWLQLQIGLWGATSLGGAVSAFRK